MTNSSTKIDDVGESALEEGGNVATVGDYYSLLKPGVMRLSIFTALIGLIAAPGHIDIAVAIAAVLSIAVGAGASGALNMWYDADIDTKMDRTKNRAVPAGRIPASEALTMGLVLSALSVFSMAFMVNFVAAGLLALTIAYYVLFYTMWLKRRSVHNTVVGGAAGALPPMIGWAAVTGDVSLASFSLFMFIFMWTPPHFWALSLYRAGDYAKAGIPMLPVVSGKKATRNQIMAYTVLLVPSSFLPFIFGVVGPAYAVIMTVLNVIFVYRAFNIWRERGEEEKLAKKLFGFSIFYLFIAFLFIGLDAGGVFGFGA
jgi:protoheme IX farnesyltransferase